MYYNTVLIVEHRISQTKINYKQEHYLDALSKGLPRTVNIDELAKKNLEAIDEVYRNE